MARPALLVAALAAALLTAPAPAAGALATITTNLYFPSLVQCRNRTALGSRFLVSTTSFLSCARLGNRYFTRDSAPCTRFGSGGEWVKRWCYDNNTLPVVGGIMGWTVSNSTRPYAGWHVRASYDQAGDRCPARVVRPSPQRFQDASMATIWFWFYRISNPRAYPDPSRPAQCTRGTGRFVTCARGFTSFAVFTGCGSVATHPFKV
ncbi:hypothetical protein DFJ74DRAFT_775027 [Hyaloraphidium curvatum]|nr:hypothetical protein DFJ74DRAFT_775027 [Hyaloraphidium curvatum]